MKAFDFFKRHRTENGSSKNEQVESLEKPKNKIDPVLEDEQSENEPQNLPHHWDDLKKYTAEMDSLGLKTDEDIINNLMKMPAGQLLESISNGENIQEEDLKNIHEEFSEILDNNLDEAYKTTGLKNFLRRPASRVAFATLLLFLKFAPHSQAHEAPVKDVGDKNIKTEKYDGDGPKPYNEADKNTYKLNSENFEPLEIKNVATMDLTNSYETDKALISETEGQVIKADFKAFLDKVDSHNFREVMKLDFKIFGSSDERLTNSWKGGNLELTQARIAAAEEILRSELANHDFSNSDLSPEQIKQLQNKDFRHGIPENGVTHITDLVNPDTEKNYTAEEVSEMKKNNLTKYNELLKDCRYIKVNLMAKANEEIKPAPKLQATLEVETKEKIALKTIDLISEYDQTVIIFDNSPSMDDSKNYMGQQLETVDRTANIKIATFSDKLDNLNQANSFGQAGEILKNIKTSGSSHEKSVLAAIDALNGFDVSGKKIAESKLLLVNTDEAIQTNKAEMDKLLLESQMKGVKIYFNLGYDNDQQVLKVSLEEMKNNFNQLYEKKLEKIQADIDKTQEQLANKSVKGEVRQVAKERLEKLEKQQKDLPNMEFKVKGFELPDGRIVNMNA